MRHASSYSAQKRYHSATERGNMSLGSGPKTAEMASERALIVDDPRFDRHLSPNSHPERPQRLAAARRATSLFAPNFVSVPARSATDEELGRVHEEGFVRALENLRGASASIDADTFVSPDSVDTARLAAGSLVALVDGLLDGPISKGVALLRPPGHHATSVRAMGFCLLNNVAVAAAHARSRGLERIAIVDWDVHHGNGTQEIFWRDPHVLYISTHQFPFYPGTGALDEIGDGDGTGFTVNVPFAAGGGDGIYASAFERIVLPVLDAYAPELILVSAGFDASARDPLGQMELSAAAFGWMGRELARIANKSARGRMALVLEGGYDLVAIDAGLQSAIAGTLFDRATELPRAPDDEALGRAVRAAKKSWSVVG